MSNLQYFRLRISGLVQGVGFRPFVWQVAQQLKITGEVGNDAQGVFIDAYCNQTTLDQFIGQLKREQPPLARIENVAIEGLHEAMEPPTDFQITESKKGVVKPGCVPDAATCDTCLEELFDSANRRFRYPFINCTHCGPRISILREIPYDRASTSMSVFEQCPNCLREYQEPTNRRFHAQPNACAECGPRMWVESSGGEEIVTDDLFAFIASQLRDGKIVALKGLGGFHLVCDATDQDVLTSLRQRKNRPAKPFALMVRDTDIAARYVSLEPEAAALLKSPAAPVVLLQSQGEPLPEAIAPGQNQLGIMLPYTPQHHLLLSAFETPLVMTSGNYSGAPQAITNDAARATLSEIADFFVMHDREIVNRMDDSVLRYHNGSAFAIRLARGYAPFRVSMPEGFAKAPDLIALGAELKSTLCFIQQGQAILSQHLGDLEDVATFDAYQHTHDLYRNLYQHSSQRYVIDLHPQYLSTQFGESKADRAELTHVQHHHAHMAACMAEAGIARTRRDILGLCFDGTGFGMDETLWGAEALYGGYANVSRVGTLVSFPLVGGAQAIREPWRALVGQLHSVGLLARFKTLPCFEDKPLRVLEQMISKQLNTPLTSSAGRLFDAVAAVLGCSADRISYEGQAAIELEALAQRATADSVPRYPFALSEQGGLYQLSTKPMWEALLQDFCNQRYTAEQIALGFHDSFADAWVELVEQVAVRNPIAAVALSGGVMQNRVLADRLSARLQCKGFSVLEHQTLPANDAGVSVGQAFVAAAKYLEN